MRSLSVLLFFLLVGASVHGQGEMPVQIYTGQPVITIPLMTITAHDIMDDISLSYNARGLRVAEGPGLVGMGFSLAAGGSIIRTVRGLPDELNSGSKKGWLFNSSLGTPLAATTGSFNAYSDSTLTTAEEASAYTALNFFTTNYDSEPDIFSVHAGSLNFNFVFDNSSTSTSYVIRTIPFVDVKIQILNYPLSTMSFLITTNDGTVYSFPAPLNETKLNTAIASPLDVFTRECNLSSVNAINYPVEWKLGSIASPLGATLTYTYTSVTNVSTADTTRVAIRNPMTPGYTMKDIYRTQITRQTEQITGISSSSGSSVSFSGAAGDCLTQISGMGKTFNLSYVKTPLGYREAEILISDH